MFDFLAPAGKHIIPYIPEISIALMACTLVMLGGEINRLLRRLMARQHFIVRTLAFIALNAFGYGLVIVKVSPYLARWMRQMDSGLLLVCVMSGFILIGLWAQKNRHV